MNTDAAIAAANAGAMVGLLSGALPLLAGLVVREYRKGLIGLSACVIAGALFGRYAALAAGITSLFAVLRAQNVRKDAEEGNRLVFRFGPVFTLLVIAGIPLAVWTAIRLLSLAFYGIGTSRGVHGLTVSTIVVGSLGAAFGLLAVFVISQWYVLLTEYTLTDEGVTEDFRSSSRFLPWSSLKSARYRAALSQIEQRFDGHDRRVVLTNSDFDIERAKLLRAVSLIERVTGRPLAKTKF